MSEVVATMFVMTIDQRGSRRTTDQVDGLLTGVASVEGCVRPFERTAGDEAQGLLDDAESVVEVSLRLARQDRWSVGIGVGDVRRPVPHSVRAATGPAFERARLAVDRAKASAPHLALVGSGESARDLEALLRLLASVVQRRTAAGWQVVDLLEAGHTQQHVARRLRITQQAVSQRAGVAMWNQEKDVRPLAVRLLRELDR